jgi:hypothetical protein
LTTADGPVSTGTFVLSEASVEFAEEVGAAIVAHPDVADAVGAAS